MILLKPIIDDAVKSLHEQSAKAIDAADFLEQVNWHEPVDESLWHQICNKCPDNSVLLCSIVQSLFPEADNIYLRRGENVCFHIYGIDCYLPITNDYRIEFFINTDLNNANNDVVNRVVDAHKHSDEYQLSEYLKFCNDNDDWYRIACKFLNKSCPRPIMFVLWFGLYKWVSRTAHSDKWKKVIEREQEAYIRDLKQLYTRRSNLRNKVETFKSKVLPKLYGFSSCVTAAQPWGLSIDDLLTHSFDSDDLLIDLLNAEGVDVSTL